MINQENIARSSALPKSYLKLIVITVFVGLFLAGALQYEVPPIIQQSLAKTAPVVEIGKDCKRCHEAVVDAFALSIHGKSGNFMEGARATDCESCHTDPAKHVKTGKKADIADLRDLPSKEINSSCLQCHSQDRHTFAWQGSKHDRKDMSCLSCHSEHHPKSEAQMLVNATVEQTCLQCHTSVRKAMFQRSSHLMRTEQQNMKVGCMSCHNPHGGQSDKMLVEETVNNTCYACHAEKRGPFLWDHPPVRENCMNCHSPHGSNNLKLLSQRANLQCQQCHVHMLPRHSTTAGKPLDIWTLNRGCVNCHAQVHGSNHPGGRTLTR